jgi:hypothetical protein
MKSRLHLNILAAIAVCLVSTAAMTRAADLAPEKVTPSKTKVLILPSIDQEPMKTVMAPLRVMIMNHHLETVFLSRQFTVLGPDMASAAAKTLSEDPTDAGNMVDLAKQTGADWVISTSITDSSLKSGTPGDLTVSVTLHVNIYDAKRKGWLMDKDFIASKNNNGVPMGPMGMYQMGIENVTDVALGPLVNDYPQIVKLGDVGNNDYLRGQTAPFTGDPKTEFDGLTPL